MTTTKRLRWGIMSTGAIAAEFADGLRESETGELVAVASRTAEKAEAFARRFRVPRACPSYAELLADPGVDAVYIAPPHPFHAEWAIAAAAAGKHLLVEKPIGMNAAEAAAIIDAAQEHGVFLMEAFMYRCHPWVDAALALLRERVVGEVRLIQASFCYPCGDPPAGRVFANALGGGGILDVGCYPLSAARRIAGVALGSELAEPLEISGAAVFGATGVDEWAAATARFPGGIVAQLAAGIRTAAANEIVIGGSDGTMRIADPWTPSRWGRDPVRIVIAARGAEREVLVPGPKDLYAYEADMVGAHVARRQAPAMTWADTLGNARALDRWRQAVGMVYEGEREVPRPRASPAPGGARMRYGRLDGLDKPVSRLVMGADTNHSLADTALLFDDYVARGGNAFDTSHHYGWPRGSCERNLGRWIRERGIRDRVVVIEKAGNPPNGTPEGLARELSEGFERLGMDRVDIFMLHRDNEEVPIGEWVDALDRHRRAGRFTLLGLSNFSLARLQAFAEHARRHGLGSFGVVSNQFSLARMLAPPWPGLHLVSSSDDEARAWFARTRTPLMSWSSQARGFFTTRASRGDRTDEDLVRCWYDDVNFARKERAERLARERGVEPTAVALAWVLAQPFPTFPLVGPKRPLETRQAFAALGIELSAEELRWLDGGERAAVTGRG